MNLMYILGYEEKRIRVSKSLSPEDYLRFFEDHFSLEEPLDTSKDSCLLNPSYNLAVFALKLFKSE